MRITRVYIDDRGTVDISAAVGLRPITAFGGAHVRETPSMKMIA